MRLMIVDDEPLVRIGIRTILEARSAGSEIVGEAGDGLAATEMALALKPDLILVDVRMPLMNGLEFIERVKPALPRTRYVILSCINEFDSVRSAMRLGVTDYIIKTTLDADELIEVIEKIRIGIIQEFKSLAEQPKKLPTSSGTRDPRETLLSLASGSGHAGSTPSPDLHALLDRIKPAAEGHYRTAIVFLEAGCNNITGTGPLALASAVNICREVVERSVSALCASKGNNTILILMVEPDGAALMEICHTIQRSLKEYLDLAVSIGLGNIVSNASREVDPDAFSASFAEAESALRYSFYTGPGAIHQLDDLVRKVPSNARPALLDIGTRGESPIRYTISRVTGTRVPDFDTLVSDCARCVRSGDMETLNVALEKALNESVEARNEKVNEVKSHYARVMFGIIERVGNFNGEAGYTLPEDYLAELMASDSIFDLVAQVAELCSTLSTIVRADCEGSGSIVIARIKEYVHLNIGKEVNLALVGERLDMNPSYISRLFKLKTGMGFGDYVINEKMKLAEEMILGGEKLSTIAERTGYSDEAALSRAFKHAEGLSPTEFRHLNLSRDD